MYAPGVTRRALTDFSAAELETLVLELGGKPFQARQLSHWLYRRGVTDLAQCSNLPRALRERLAEATTLRGSSIARSDKSGDRTIKHLVRLADAETVEMVVIPEGDRRTLCISTQVGCPVRCVFCASGLEGVRRNLTTGEIVEQVLHGRAGLGDARLTNIVVMGMGEPLLNLANLLPALERIHDPEGIGLGARRVTVSTSGYPDRIAELARAPHQYQLAVSLHAANDELRRTLVPTAKARVRDIVEAAGRYAEAKGREVTFEVVLLAGVNDRPQDADALVRALRGQHCTVNLIPWNPVAEIEGLRTPDRARVLAFAASLSSGGLKVTVRRQRGADRSAACGQLRIRAAAIG